MALERRRTLRERGGSVRSRGSSSVSSSDPREKLKDCCRKFVAFMFTQVGVGAVVVCYAIAGAFAFMSIEAEVDSEINETVDNIRTSCVKDLWNVTDHLNVLHKDKWYFDVRKLLINYQQNISQAIKSGYDGRSNAERWSFPSALMFSLSVFTMIGFGHLVPRTDWGKIATMLYAVFGIPVYVLYFMNMGQVLASTFKWIYCKMVSCTASLQKEKPAQATPGVDSAVDQKGAELNNEGGEDSGSSLEEDLEEQPIIVPSTACLWVFIIYLLCGTIMFAEWEGWDYLDACYFCVTSLCKIGLGDFVPGSNIIAAHTPANQTKLIINFFYLLVGMGIVAMCYNLMKEEVLLRLQEIKADLLDRLQDMGLGRGGHR